MELDCEVFKSYEESKRWLEIVHTGQNDGRGRRGWTADQQSRFTGKDRNSLALSVLDFAEKSGFISSDERKRTLTTATRYFSNPIFRQIMGVTSGVSSSDIEINIPQKDFERAVKKFCDDLCSDQALVTSRAKAADCIQYAVGIKQSENLPDGSSNAHLLSSVKPTKTKRSNTRSPDARKYIIPSDFKPNIKDDLYREFRQVEFNLNYSVQTKRKGQELLVFSKTVKAPDIVLEQNLSLVA